MGSDPIATIANSDVAIGSDPICLAMVTIVSDPIAALTVGSDPIVALTIVSDPIAARFPIQPASNLWPTNQFDHRL